jgi:hypothetical protein
MSVRTSLVVTFNCKVDSILSTQYAEDWLEEKLLEALQVIANDSKHMSAHELIEFDGPTIGVNRRED